MPERSKPRDRNTHCSAAVDRVFGRGRDADPRVNTNATRRTILATLRKRGPSTALELQNATGLSATTIRRHLIPPAVTLLAVEYTPTGRGWTKRYQLTANWCDCGQPAAYRLAVRQLSADGNDRAEALELCPACVELLPPNERRNIKRMR